MPQKMRSKKTVNIKGLNFPKGLFLNEGEKTEPVTVQMNAELKNQLEGIVQSVNSIKGDTLKSVEDVKNSLDGKIGEQNKKLEGIEASVNMLSISTKDASQDDPKRGFKNNIEFFNAVIQSGMNGMRVDKMPKNLVPLFNAVGSDESRVSSNPDGGFLIPPAFMPGVMTTDGSALQSDTGLRTRKVPMSSPVVEINARVDKNHTSSVSGGFRVFRKEEAATVEATKSTFEQVKLEAHGLMGLSFATEEILARSPISFAALIQTGFADEKISKLNYERLWGSGVGEFLGIQNSPALVTVAKESTQTADTINGTNLVKMKMRCWGYNNAVWMANQDTELQLTAAHIALTNTDIVRLYDPDTQRLLGRPVIFDENMATLGDLGDIVLANWNEYLEGNLGGNTFDESIHVRFVYNERAFRFTAYNDGQPWWRTVLTPKKSAVTLSPFVTLAAR